MKNLTLIVAILINSSVFAQQIITERPAQTVSSSTISKGGLQIESGFLLGMTEPGEIGGFEDFPSISTRRVLAPTTLFRYGLTKRIEIRVLNQYEIISWKSWGYYEKTFGFSDMEIGTKIQILKNENKNTEIAFLSHLIIPSGSTSFSNNNYASINKLSISHNLNDNIGLGYNFGYNYYEAADDYVQGKGDLTYSMALGIGISENAGVYVEHYGEFVDLTTKHVASIDMGFTYLLNDNFQLDFSFGTGINHIMNYISSGFSWHIGREKSDSQSRMERINTP